MKSYYGLGLCYLAQPSASADNTNLCLDNSSYPTRPHSIIVYCFGKVVKPFTSKIICSILSKNVSV